MNKRKSLITFYLPLAAISVFILFPYVWTLLTSLKNNQELHTKQVVYFPKNPTLENYKTLFEKTNFFNSMGNSFAVAVVTCVVALIVAFLAGYAFSRYRFPGRRIILGGVLLLYMFPQVLYLFPFFLFYRGLGLYGSLLSLIISYTTFTVPFSMWLMAGFINEIPTEIDEAAKIDGASLPQLLGRVLLPLVRPGLIAAGSYIFINAWNEYLFAVMFTTSDKRTLPVEIASYMGEYTIRWDLLCAGGIVAVIPVVILFMLVQKHLISGITAGSVKG